MINEEQGTGDGGQGTAQRNSASRPPTPDPRPLAVHHSSLAKWLELAVAAWLFMFALCAPHSIAATQISWLLALVLWVARFVVVRPRPRLERTPVDYALLGFFILTFISALLSYDPYVSIGKLRAASLFTIVYVVAENISDRRTVRRLALVLVASCMLNVMYTFGAFAVGRGVKVREWNAGSPLAALGVHEGDTLLSVDGVPVNNPADVERAIRDARAAGRVTMRWPNGEAACTSSEREACVRAYRAEVLFPVMIERANFLEGAPPDARLGIKRWTRGRDERATGFYGQYMTYAEVLQLIASLALGLLVARRRVWDWQSALLGLALAGLIAALILTVTRAPALGFLLSAFTIALVGARRRTLLIVAAIALPLVVAGLFVLQQKRQVGFIDPQEGSTAWRLVVWREGFDVLVQKPRHLLVGVGMDSLKRHWREWGMFDGGKLPWGHLHSTPLQIAFERGLPTLFAWLALLFIYGRMLWRLARRGVLDDWIERGLVLGALGGLVGFCASGMVHYNLGDSEVAEIFYFIMGLTLVIERCARVAHGAQESGGVRVQDGAGNSLKFSAAGE